MFFENEPYEGVLTEFDNVILTAHIGASAVASRFMMEWGATDQCIKLLKGKKIDNLVTEKDYE